MVNDTADRMHRPDESMTDLVLEVVRERLLLGEAPLDALADRAALGKALDGLIREEGRDVAEVLQVYSEKLAPTVLSADSPRMFAFIPSAPTKASLLFDMVLSAASIQGISMREAAGAVMAENQALRILADAARLPQDAGGVFVSGGSAANLSALVVAREVARRRRDSTDGYAVMVSDQAHSSIEQTLMITGMRAVVVPTASGRMEQADIEACLAGLDAKTADSICAIVATSGTTNAGIIDDISASARIAKSRGWWLHVDGAYGGAGLMLPELQHLYDGIEFADSVVMDPHKWWFAPFDCAALLYRDPTTARQIHTQHASYLDVIHGDDDLNPSDLAYHLTRRARGLPLWFSLAVNGLAAYRDAIRHSVSLARDAATALTARNDCELVMEPTLGIVLFRRIGWGREDYEAWAHALLEDQVAFVASSSWRGEVVGRLAFLHPGTTSEMLDAVLDRLDGGEGAVAVARTGG